MSKKLGLFEIGSKLKPANPKVFMCGNLDLPFTGGIQRVRRSNFEGFYDDTLKSWIDERIAKVLYEDEFDVVFVSPKDAVNSEYDFLLNIFPKGKNRAAHLISDVRKNLRDVLVHQIEALLEKIRLHVESNGRELDRVYVLNHFGEEEDTHLAPFATTHPQHHWHIYAYPADCALAKGEESLVHNDSFRNAFYDPTIYIARDLLMSSFLDQNLCLDHSTSSLALPSKPYAGKLHGFDLLPPYVDDLKKRREELRRILCKDELGAHGRYRTKPVNERRKLVNRYKKINTQLTKKAKAMLDWLAENIKDSAGLGFPYQWNDFFLGMAGSVGWSIDCRANTQTLRLAPRTFVTKEKIGATDGKYYTHKDRANYAPLAERESILSIQREILSSMD